MGSTLATAVAIDGSGNAVLVGSISGTADFGGGVLTTSGATDIFITKVNAAGKHVWSKLLANPQAESLAAAAIDPTGNILVAGDFDGVIFTDTDKLTSVGGGDVLVAKLDPAGFVLWAKGYGDAQYQHATGIAADGSGNAFVTGEFEGSIDLGGGPLGSEGKADVFLTKLDPTGGHLWSKRFGDNADQYAAAVAVNAAGNVAVTGSFQGAVDFGSGSLNSTAIDIYLAKFDSSGTPAWSKRFGTSGYNAGTSLAMDNAGNTVLTGTFFGAVDFGNGVLTTAGDSDIFVAKFDPSGATLWSKHFGDASGKYGSRGKSIAVDPAGDVIVTGTFEGTIDLGGGPLISSGERDYFIVKLDPSGNYLWSTRFGNNADQTEVTVAAYDSTNVLLTGRLSGSIDFGGGPLANTSTVGASDTFLAKLLTP